MFVFYIKPILTILLWTYWTQDLPVSDYMKLRKIKLLTSVFVFRVIANETYNDW